MMTSLSLIVPTNWFQSWELTNPRWWNIFFGADFHYVLFRPLFMKFGSTNSKSFRQWMSAFKLRPLNRDILDDFAKSSRFFTVAKFERRFRERVLGSTVSKILIIWWLIIGYRDRELVAVWPSSKQKRRLWPDFACCDFESIRVCE